jgi:hypothetical protein
MRTWCLCAGRTAFVSAYRLQPQRRINSIRAPAPWIPANRPGDRRSSARMASGSHERLTESFGSAPARPGQPSWIMMRKGQLLRPLGPPNLRPPLSRRPLLVIGGNNRQRHLFLSRPVGIGSQNCSPSLPSAHRSLRQASNPARQGRASRSSSRPMGRSTGRTDVRLLTQCRAALNEPLAMLRIPPLRRRHRARLSAAVGRIRSFGSEHGLSRHRGGRTHTEAHRFR